VKVFISSTSLDLQPYRAAVANALERLGQQAGRMEVFGARPDSPSGASLAEVDACDLFVGIYAHRYGFVPPGSDASITEQEFLRACEREKPLFCFVVADDHPWPPAFIDGEPQRARLLAFKERVGRRVVRDIFTTPDDLALRAGTAVGRHLLERLSAQLRGQMDRAGLSAEELARGRRFSSIPETVRGPIITSLNQLSELMQTLRAREAPPAGSAIDPAAILTLAFGLAGRGLWREAAETYTQYTDRVPGHWLAQFLRGVAFVNTRDGPAENLAALRAYNEAIAFAPPDIDPNTRARLFGYRGAVLKRLGRLEEAEADLLIAQRHAVQDYEVDDVWYNLSGVYALRGDRDGMLAAVRKIRDVGTLGSIRAHLDDYYAQFQDDPELLRMLGMS
jgi:tetratricopeptide (TPR) repeat protein